MKKLALRGVLHRPQMRLRDDRVRVDTDTRHRPITLVQEVWEAEECGGLCAGLAGAQATPQVRMRSGPGQRTRRSSALIKRERMEQERAEGVVQEVIAPGFTEDLRVLDDVRHRWMPALAPWAPTRGCGNLHRRPDDNPGRLRGWSRRRLALGHRG